MRRTCLVLSIFFLVTACHHKTLNEQLAVAFTGHLKLVDPDARMDSVHLLWSTAVNQKLARTIDDTMYVREYNRIKVQQATAVASNDKDSIEFYAYEIQVLEHNIDSISKSIGEADTTHRFGSLLSCAYYLTRNGRQVSDSTFLFLDSTNTLRYIWFMDSAIAKTSRSTGGR